MLLPSSSKWNMFLSLSICLFTHLSVYQQDTPISVLLLTFARKLLGCLAMGQQQSEFFKGLQLTWLTKFKRPWQWAGLGTNRAVVSECPHITTWNLVRWLVLDQGSTDQLPPLIGRKSHVLQYAMVLWEQHCWKVGMALHKQGQNSQLQPWCGSSLYRVPSHSLFYYFLILFINY